MKSAQYDAMGKMRRGPEESLVGARITAAMGNTRAPSASEGIRGAWSNDERQITYFRLRSPQRPVRCVPKVHHLR